MRRSEMLLTLISVIASFVTLIFVDLSPIIKSLAAMTGVNLKNADQLYTWLDIFFRISMFLFIILLIIVIDSIVYERRILWHKQERYYTCDDVVEYLRNIKDEISTITILGYSLSFAESLRLYLESTHLVNLDVKVILPNPDYILNNCKENKDINIRIHQIKGRIIEWLLLVKDGRVSKVSIYHFDGVPQENGIIINDNIVFFGRYPWKLDGNKFMLNKNPVKERVMKRMSDKNDLVYTYILQTARLRQRDLVNAQYEVMLP